MEVVSECPLTVGSVLWQSGPRAWTLTVVAKATYLLAPDLSQLAREQEPVHAVDGHWDDDPSCSLTVASDLVPFKRRPEVMLVGHAHAPHRDGVASLVARLAISAIDKAIEVHGDRHFTHDGRLTEPLRFKRMPLRWERAAGGPDTSNPVGVLTGTDARFDVWGRCALPNLVPVGTVATSPYDPIEPVGFGPIAPRWPTRAARLAGLGAGFDPARWSASPLPEHLDAGFFDAAPRDQQLTLFDGTESFLLEHLHPHHPVLASRLAPARPQAVFEWGRGRALDIGLACDTLVIDTDRGLATLAFRGHIALDHPQRAGRIVVTIEGPSEPRASVPDWLHRVEDVVATVAGEPEGDGTTLPFLNDEEMPTLPNRPRPALRLRTGTQQGTEIPVAPALPFRSPAPPGPSATGTLLPFRVPSSPALPFRKPSPELSARSRNPEETLTLDGAPSPYAAPARSPRLSAPDLPFVVPPPQEAAARAPLLAALAHLPGTHEETVDGDALVEEIESAAEAHDDHEEIEPEPESDPRGALPPSASVPPRLLDTFTIERCARIAASLACRPTARAEVLRAHGLDEPTWARLDDHWARALFEEGERQRNALLKQHDAAYVAQIEDERGPLTIEEYAHLLVASERHGPEPVLAALGLPADANMRIRRVWIARIARDMDFGARVRRALSAERSR